MLHKLCRSRKGNVLFTIAELVIAAVVIFLFVNGAIDVSTSAASQRHYLTNDIATTMNALHAVPGDVEYNYATTDLQKFKLTVQNGIVKVSEPSAVVMGESVQTIATYPGSVNEDLSKVIALAPDIQFLKIKEEIDVKSAPQYQLRDESTPDVATRAASCSGDCN